jgi:hypothetical protein
LLGRACFPFGDDKQNGIFCVIAEKKVVGKIGSDEFLWVEKSGCKKKQHWKISR